MSYKISFGTDGWRGVIAEDYTFDNVRRASQGFASYLVEQGFAGRWVVIGYDKRFHSENFAAAAAEVLVGSGLNVYLTNGATPTPVIAFAVVDKKACGAVNITASHNPPTDNGFKVRDQNGGAIDPEGLKRIEALIPDSAEVVKRIPLDDAMPRDADAPAHYWFSNLHEDIHWQPMVDTVMGRWRIERDYLELKQELGLGHFEGRNWRGFHHHASLCVAAYGFLMLERLSGAKKNSARFKTSALPAAFRPRGAGADL